MKSSSIGAKLLTLSGVLLLCLLGMGALSWYNSRQLGGTLHLASQSIRGVISDSASAAGQLVEECRALNGVIADSDAQKEAERRLNYSAMGETALRLMDRRIDNAKFLADACVKSEEVRANVSGFMHVSQTEGGDNPGAYNGADDPKEARNRLEDFVAALTSSAGADFYAVVGVGGKLNGKVLSSNKDTLYNENLSSSPLIVTAIRNNRISKGFDRIGKNMTLASAAFIKNKKGEDVAVFMAGYTVDAPALRFLAEDLRANVSLYLPGAGGKMGLAHTTVTGEDGKLAQQVAIPQNVTQAFESKLAANRADKSKTSNSGTLRKEFSHITHLDVGPLRYDGAFQAIFTEAGELGGVLFVGRNSTESVAKETAIHQRAAQAVTKADAIEQSWRIPDVTQSGNTSGAKENSLTQALSVANRSQVILKRAATLTVVGICTSFLLGAALSWGMTRSIRNTLNRLMGMLKYTASQVESSSAHVSEFSHSLAEGASSQAASLEETSASLEEILSMTRRNSDNAQQAKSLANETRQAAEAGTAEILAMNQAISEMKTSSDTVGKIIKTIDEIAFQTNILALNAAIEAARAGEAGLGFAVVADEVRNLAHRSTEASRETAATIEQSIRTSGRGVALSQKVGQRLDEILQRVRNVDQLVGDIAAASTEQTHGIQQVNQAVSAMDTITQTNAAGAEEGASAGEHLINQSKELNLVVVELEKMVGGRSSIAGSEPKSPPSNPSGDGFPSPKDSGLHRTIRPKESAIAA